MSLPECVRAMTACAVLCWLREMGEQADWFTKSPTGTETSGLYVLPLDPSHRTGLKGGRTDLREITFFIPRQTGFPVTASGTPSTSFHVGDTIRYPATDGTKYAVDSVKPNMMSETLASAFTVRCSRHGIDVDLEGE